MEYTVEARKISWADFHGKHAFLSKVFMQAPL